MHGSVLLVFLVICTVLNPTPVASQCSSFYTCFGADPGDDQCCRDSTHGGVSDRCCGSGGCTRVDTTSNCLDCGLTCSAGFQAACCTNEFVDVCQIGGAECQQCMDTEKQCPTGTQCCKVLTTQGCKDVNRDDLHCLSCGTPCLPGEHCCPVNGVEGCHVMDYATNLFNCGSCGRACINAVACVSGTCACQPGFSGPICSTNINECISNPCINGGTCNDAVNGYICACKIGYTGSRCQINVDECSPNPCQNGGVCTDGVASFTCACTSGFSGSACQVFPLTCPTALCTNGATCVEGSGSYTCVCRSGYSGVYCQTEINECASSPCRNGGTCLDGIGSFTCSCAAGFLGAVCQTNINECASNPCRNGGTCIDGTNGFSCSCVAPFAGTLCRDTPSIASNWGAGMNGHCMLSIDSGPAKGVYAFAGRNSSSGFTAPVWKSVLEPYTFYTLATASAPFERRYQAACTVHYPVKNDSSSIVMVMSGGIRPTNIPLADVWTSADGANWVQRTANAPWGARGFHGMASNGSVLFVFGGRTTPEPDVSHGDVWISSDLGSTWVRIGSPVAPWGPRDSFASAFWMGRIWIVNGRNGTAFTPVMHADVWSSADGVTWTKEPASGVPSHRFASVLVADNTPEGRGMYLFSGSAMQTGDGFNDFYQTRDGRNWCRVTDVSQPLDLSRVWAAGVAVNGSVYISGGFNRLFQEYSPNVWRFRPPFKCDEQEQQWQQLPSGPWGPRCGHALVCAPGACYLIGGSNSSTCASSSLQNDVWQTRDGLTWSFVGFASPMPRLRDHSAIYHPATNSIIVCGGMTNTSAPIPACYQWDFSTWSLLFSNFLPGSTGLTMFGMDTNGTVIYFVGGQMTSIGSFSPYTVTWDPSNSLSFRSNRTWNGTAEGHFGITSVVWRERLWTIGGLSSSGTRASHIIAPRLSDLTSHAANGYPYLVAASAQFTSRNLYCFAEAGNSSLFMAGGRSNSQLEGHSDAYVSGDGLNWSRVSNIPVALRFTSSASTNEGRYRASCASVGTGVLRRKQVLMVGGYDPRSATFVSDVLAFGSNPCISWPCSNGGSCSGFNGTFTCACAPGFSGISCQSDVNECASSPCGPGLVCVDMVNGYVCTADRCSSNPCQNGATCVDDLGGYTCTCVQGFAGILCQTNINECASNPCQYGGTCSDGVASYTCACPSGHLAPDCVCPPGFAGLGCTVNIDECASSPCMNGGTCVDLNNTFACVCPGQYPGPLCNPAVLPCSNRDEVVDFCGKYGLSCFKRCFDSTGPCTAVQNCTCQQGHGFPFTDKTCGYDYVADRCTGNQGSQETRTRTCGPFTVSAARVCPSNSTADLDFALCHDNCTCAAGFGRTPGSSIDCDGQDVDCDPIDVTALCGKGYSSCRKRCRFAPPYVSSSECHVLPNSCVSATTSENCTDAQYHTCGPATATCVATFLGGILTSTSCVCTSSGFTQGGVNCAEWQQWDFSDADPSYSLNPSSCYQQCGPGVMLSGRQYPGFQYLRTPDDSERGLRGEYNCARRRYWLPTLSPSVFTLTAAGSFEYDSTIVNGGTVDLQFQWLVRNGIVSWNGTGWSDNMEAVRSLSFVSSFWVRHCDCHGPLPVDGTYTLNRERPLVYSTYASVTTVMSSSSRLLVNACRSTYSNRLTASSKIASVVAAETFAMETDATRNPESNAACSGRGRLRLTTLLLTDTGAPNSIQIGSTGFTTLPLVNQTEGLAQICQKGALSLGPSLGDAAVTAAPLVGTQNPPWAFILWLRLPSSSASVADLVRLTRGSKRPFRLQTQNRKLLISLEGGRVCESESSLSGGWNMIAIQAFVLVPGSVAFNVYVNGVYFNLWDSCNIPDQTVLGIPHEVRIGPGESQIAKLWFYSQIPFNSMAASAFYYNGPSSVDQSPVLLYDFAEPWSLPVSINEPLVANTGADTLMPAIKVASGQPSNVFVACYPVSPQYLRSCDCAPGWSGDSCQIQNCCIMASTCQATSDACAVLFTPGNVAQFWEPYRSIFSCDFGQVCSELALAGLGRLLCNSRGYLRQTLASSQYSCSCDLGLVTNGQGCSATPPCNGRGTITQTGTNATYACTCQDGWTGKDCQIANNCPTLAFPSSSHVTGCDYTVVPARWKCAITGRGAWSGTQCSTWTPVAPCLASGTAAPLSFPVTVTYGVNASVLNLDAPQCTCRTNSTSATCSVPSCPSSGGLVCGGRGSCVAGTCVCDSPYEWDGCACSLSRAPCLSLESGCFAPSNRSLPQCDTCSFSGTCANVYSSLSQIGMACECEPQFTDKYCQSSVCNYPSGCGTGTCTTDSFGSRCVCNPRADTRRTCSGGDVFREGAGCTVDVCSQCGSLDVGGFYTLCSGKGECSEQSPGVYSCACADGYTGSKCQFAPCAGLQPPNSYCNTRTATPAWTCLPGYFPSGVCSSNACGANAVPQYVGSLPTSLYYCACNNSTQDNSTCSVSSTVQPSTCCSRLACPRDPSGVVCGFAYNQGSAPACGSGGACSCPYNFRLHADGYCVPYCNSTNMASSIATTLCSVGLCASPPLNFLTPCCSGCVCQPGYSPQSRCDQSLCQNGGTPVSVALSVSPSGFYCQCRTGYRGSLCEEKVCSGVGSFDSAGACVCAYPYSGSICEQSLCVNGVPSTTVAGACSCISTAWNGTLCDNDRCVPGGYARLDSLGCQCDQYHTGPLCVDHTCQNGASFNRTSGRCNCTPQFSGALCAFPRCGNTGVWNETISACVCTSQVVAPDSNGNCTQSLCGTYGRLAADQQTCICLNGTATLNRTSTGRSRICEPVCLNNGTYSDELGVCACPQGTLQPFCSTESTSSVSSTGLPSHSNDSSNSNSSSSSSTGVNGTTQATSAANRHHDLHSLEAVFRLLTLTLSFALALASINLQ